MKTTLDLLVLILATYRAAQLLSLDEGPMWVFENLRRWFGRRAFAEQKRTMGRLGIWQSLAKGIKCPFCVGVWLAAAMLLINYIDNPLGNLLLYVLAIAGGQSFLQELIYERSESS